MKLVFVVILYAPSVFSALTVYNMSLCMKKPTIWVPTRSDTNRAVQSQKMVRGGNKGTDQLRSYSKADLRLCFRLCKLLVFPCSGSYVIVQEKNVLLNTTIYIYLLAMHDISSKICFVENVVTSKIFTAKF